MVRKDNGKSPKKEGQLDKRFWNLGKGDRFFTERDKKLFAGYFEKLKKNHESKEFNSQLINRDVYEKLHAKLAHRVWTRSEERKFKFAPEADNGYETLTNFRFATKFFKHKHKGRSGADWRMGTLPNES